MEICDLVESEMYAGTVSLPGQSFLATEIIEVQQPDRRAFLGNYICESMIALLLGVLDQARCTALSLDRPGVAISPYVLMRGLLEYSYKITYIADAQIDREERIRRALMLYITEIREYQKMPRECRSASADQRVSSGKGLANCWYRELTGKDLRTVTTQAIMDSVWKAGGDRLQEQSPGQNTIYEQGYRTGSVVAHGNTWAIRHFCLQAHSIGASRVIMPGLREPVLYDLLELAARILQLSFGFVVQAGRILPAGVMNRLEDKIYQLVTLRAATQPN